MNGNEHKEEASVSEAPESVSGEASETRQLTLVEQIALTTAMGDVERAKQRYVAVMKEIGLDPAVAYTLAQDGTVRAA